MSAPNVGDVLPENTKFTHIPQSGVTSDFKACGVPIAYNASKGTLSHHLSIKDSN